MSKIEDKKTAEEIEHDAPLNVADEEPRMNEDSKKNEEVEKLNKLLGEEKESRLRVLADFDNYKKRVAKEREEMNLLGNATILNMMLEVASDFERGIGELENVPVGLSMIKDKISNFLKEQDIEEIEVKVDEKFDPQIMEAIGTITVNEDEKVNKVIHVDRNAYRLKNKNILLQTARVIVGKKA